MFDHKELQFLFNAVEAFGPSKNTEIGRTKASVMAKLCDALEPEPEPNEPPLEPAKDA